MIRVRLLGEQVAGRALRHGWTTCADGLSVVFFPPSVCKACGEEYVDRSCTTTAGKGKLEHAPGQCGSGGGLHVFRSDIPHGRYQSAALGRREEEE